MKVRHWFTIALSLLLVDTNVFAQANQPPAPKLLVVSIDPATNNVTMKWEHNISVSFPIDYYTPRKLEYPRTQILPISYPIGSTVAYPNSNTTIPSSAGTLVNVAQQAFCLTATSTVPNTNPSALTDYHHPVFLTGASDPCSAQGVLKWYRYKATDANLNEEDSYHKPFNASIEYEVWGYQGNHPFNQTLAVKLRDKSTDTTFNTETLITNQNYFFFIKTFLPQGYYLPNGGEISYSNVINAMYTGLAVPTFINFPKVEVKEDAVELNFQIDPSSQLTTYTIERTTDLAQGFSVIYQFTDKTLTSYTDNDVNQNQPYYYRVSASQCNAYVKLSKVVSTILVNSEYDKANSDALLEWSASFDPGSTYAITRVVPDNTLIVTGLSATSYADNIHTLVRQGYDRFCYQITATAPNGDISISNQSCFIVDNDVHMPDAIDPTNIMVNSTSGAQRNLFGPIVDMVDNMYGYELTIFNRWGVKLFEVTKKIGESLSPNHFWNSEYKGKLVEPGLYLYTIHVQFTNSKKSLKGNVFVYY
ncbi:MAG: gliding motility-associated C-terminal domain-containing protein [Prevotellaceae bacterium]|jgi:hypothetical protein|nr:gliding motility-associated C-terminal domain-containing protein [Prevotellaceae bacterium]